MSPSRCHPTPGLKFRPRRAAENGPGPGPVHLLLARGPGPAQPYRSRPGLTGCWSLRKDDLRLAKVDRGGPWARRAPAGRLPGPPGPQPGRTRIVNPAAPAGPGQRPLAQHSVTQISHHWHEHLNSVITGMISEPTGSGHWPGTH